MKHLIIGNGPAGVVAAETLRKADPKCEITLLGDEREPPYSRMAIPYYLIGNIDEAGTYLRKDKDHFSNLRINLSTGRAKSVDAKSRRVMLEDGKSLEFDCLLIATGSHPIKPPITGIDSPGVHSCWTMEDARNIIKLARPKARVLQIGAGFIGCIILEALASRGVDLSVVEMGDRMVPRMMTPGAGEMIRKWCESKGVKVHVNAKVDSIAASSGGGLLNKLGQMVGIGEPGDKHLVAKLNTGAEIPADLIICAAGVKPNIAFLQGSGVECATGVLVDETMQTSVPGIYAAGDVAEAVDFNTGKRTINAIQPNAVEQGRIAALNMAGGKARSQGALAINVLDTLGLISSSFGQWWGAEGGESAELNDPKDYRYLSLQFKDDVLVGATSIGLTEHVGVLHGLIQTRTPLGAWKGDLMRDPTRVMEAYLARAQSQSEWPKVRAK